MQDTYKVCVKTMKSKKYNMTGCNRLADAHIKSSENEVLVFLVWLFFSVFSSLHPRMRFLLGEFIFLFWCFFRVFIKTFLMKNGEPIRFTVFLGEKKKLLLDATKRSYNNEANGCNRTHIETNWNICIWSEIERHRPERRPSLPWPPPPPATSF